MIHPPERLPPFRRFAAFGEWLNRLRDYAASLQPQNSPGMLTSHTALGTFRRPIGGGTTRKVTSIAGAPVPGAIGNSGPLDQAIYSRIKKKIYAVRGQYVYVFAADGSLEKEFRWVDDALDETSLVELPADPDLEPPRPWNLFCGMWRNTRDDLHSDPGEFVSRDIFRVDPHAETSEALGLSDQLDPSLNRSLTAGFMNLTTDGEFIFGSMRESVYLFRVDPTDISTFAQHSGPFGGPVCQDSFYDPVRAAVVANSYNAREIEQNDPFSLGNTSWLCGDPPNRSAPLGVTLRIDPGGDPDDDRYYAVTADGRLRRADDMAGFPAETTSLLTGLQAARLKWRSKLDRIYIPDWSNDRVLIYNPLTDTVQKTLPGFASPFDVVFTDDDDDATDSTKRPGQAYAVQLCSQGLKPIDDGGSTFDSGKWKLND